MVYLRCGMRMCFSISSSRDEFSLTCVFLLVDSYLSWAFTSVYGPHSQEDKLKFWEDLRSIRDGWRGPSCVAGDFNEILHNRERSTGTTVQMLLIPWLNFMTSLIIQPWSIFS